MPILYLLLNCLLFFNKEVFKSQIIWGPDSPKIFFPKTLVLSEWLKNLSFPLWTPYVNFGYPLAAEGEMGLLYPLNWIHLLTSASVGINFLSLLHVFMAGLFTYYFLKTIGLSKIPSLFGSLAFMFSGMIVSHLQNLAIVYSYPYMPLALTFVYKYFINKNIKYLSMTSLVLALPFLTGHPNIPFMSSLFVLFFTLYLSKTNLFSPKEIVKTLFFIFMPLALLILPRLIDSLTLIPLSVRSGNVDFLDATNGSLSIFDLITYIFPHFFFENLKNSWVFSPTFHFWTYWGGVETAIYIGIPTLILAFFGINKLHPLKKFFIISFFVSLLISFGRNTPIYELTIFKIPVINALRDPARYMYIGNFCLIFLASLGLEKLLSAKKDLKTAFSLVVMTLLIPLSTFSLHSFFVQSPQILTEIINRYYQTLGPSTETARIVKGFINSLSFENTKTETLILFLSLFSVLLVTLIKPRFKKIASLSLLFLLSIDLLINTAPINFHSANEPLLSPPQNLQTIKNTLENNNSRLYTFMSFWSDYMPLQLLPQKVLDGNGQTGLALKRYTDYQKEAEKEWLENKSGKLFSLGSIQKVFGDKKGSPVLSDNDSFLPRIYTVQNYQIENDPTRILDTLKSPSFDPKTTVVLEEEPDVNLQNISNHQNEILIPKFKDNKVTIETTTQEPSLLVLTDSFYPSWTASIDGKSTKIYQTNFLFRSVYLPGGNHKVEFNYKPIPFYISLIISLATLTMILIFLLNRKSIKIPHFDLPFPESQKTQVLLLLIFTPLIYFLFFKNPTPFDYYTRLSKSILTGKIYLTENPSWLNELIPDPKGGQKYYIAYPPMPAIISLPFVVLNKDIPQNIISIIIGSLNSVLAFLVVKKIIKDDKSKTPFWTALLFTFGTNHIFLATAGSAWYFAHIVSAFFLFLTILETFGKKRPLLIGLLLGASYWARLPTILALPFFLLMTKDKINFIFLLKFAIGLLVFLNLNFIYNFLRFGTILDIGYTLIPNVLNEPWFRYGIFSIKYIPDHLKIIFTALPSFSNKFPYIDPGFVGLALWFVTPAFLIALLAPIKKLVTISSWLAILLISLPSLMHGTVGFSQFGYRFAMDYTPFLIILVALGIKKEIKWYHKLLVVLSILVNIWGVLLARMGWVTF